MKSIVIDPPHLQEMIQHAKRDYPNECCGFGFGRGNRVLEVVPICNIALNQRVAYLMDEHEQLKALFNALQKGYEIICIYHSHPNADPIPSQSDINQNHYPSVAHCIIGINTQFAEVGVWQIEYENIERLSLTNSVDHEPTDIIDNPIKNLIHIAVLLMVAVLVIGVAVYLLPPAPELPLP